jgi:membrane protease YdiL (CAAX protease family)
MAPLALPMTPRSISLAFHRLTNTSLHVLCGYCTSQESTDKANELTLTNANALDVVYIACLAGISEELLFRYGLIPATFPDYRGVLISGILFGLLHR